MLVFDERGKSGVPGGKPLIAEYRTNKLNPHMTPGAEIELGPHWWKASALTTRPTLPPQLLIHFLFSPELATPPSTISTTKERPYVISSKYTQNQLSTNDDLNEESGKNKEKRQSDEEGILHHNPFVLS